MLRGLRLDMYWDGARTPAVSAPLGDFFGVGIGSIVPFHSAIFSSPEGRSFNVSVPMPFRNGMRIVLMNESGVDQPQVYYDVDYTLGDRHPPGALYFHAHFRRENPTKFSATTRSCRTSRARAAISARMSASLSMANVTVKPGGAKVR